MLQSRKAQVVSPSRFAFPYQCMQIHCKSIANRESLLVVSDFASTTLIHPISRAIKHKIVITIITILYWIFHMPCIQLVSYWTHDSIALGWADAWTDDMHTPFYSLTPFFYGVCMLNITRIFVVFFCTLCYSFP